MMTIKHFPESAADLPVDFSHPNKALLSGLFEENVNGRTFLTYIPENQEY